MIDRTTAASSLLAATVLLLLLATSASAQNCRAGDGSVASTVNPLGACQCDGHLWVAQGCREGYWCADTTGLGCHLSCPEGQILTTNWLDRTWACREMGVDPVVCPGGYNVCPSDNVAPLPEEPVTENPLGTCRCDGELWVSEGCSYAFHCNSSQSDGGDYIGCTVPGESVQVDLVGRTWVCGTEDTCPGGQINGVGCAMPECEYAKNEIGQCECDKQFFIDEDCTTGFYCQTNIPDPFTNDGCIQRCADGEILIPDFKNVGWRCESNADGQYACPGYAKLECPANDIGNDFNNTVCECDGQLHVSSNCRNGFFCASRIANGGRSIRCPPGQIISVDVKNWQWACVSDESGQCPGMGGFKLGCADGAPELPPDPVCQAAANPISKCDCANQFFINDDCTQGFYCDDPSTATPTDEGCIKTCNADSILVPDFATKGWACMGNWNGERQCPGEFKLECDSIGNFDQTDCECQGQLLVDGDCRTGFFCLAALPNGGKAITCAEGQIIGVNLATFQWECKPDDGMCPGLGGFKVGCGLEEATEPPPYDCRGGQYSTNNPLGTCTCEGHLFVNRDCSQGYYCVELDGRGCHITCPPGTIVSTNFTTTTWECRSTSLVEAEAETGLALDDPRWSACPIGGFNICPSDTVGTTPNPDTVTSNPLGTCRCNGELWLAEGCRYAFYCDDTQQPLGGFQIACPENFVVVVDEATMTWSCSDNLASCFGAINGIGCNTLECTSANNHLGTCDGCEGQLFMHSDCKEGFYCTDNIPQPFLYDGCVQRCGPNEILVPNFVDLTWSCVDNSDNSLACPGKFNVECPANDIGQNFNSSMCECDGELMVSGNCMHAFYCFSRMSTGGRHIDCPEGQIIHVNVKNYQVTCIPDDGSCPGQGGFKVGCGIGRPVPPPPQLECQFMTNMLPDTTCACEGEIHISKDCKESFYCTNQGPAGTDGCHLKCEGANEIVFLDRSDYTWRCIERPANFICPGQFSLDCERTFDVRCSCANEVWMNGDCTMAFVCSGPNLGTVNPGALTTCPAGQYIDIDFYNALSYRCTTEKKCMGSFHFGCNSDWSTLATTLFTTPPAGGSSGATNPATTTTTTTPRTTTTTTSTTTMSTTTSVTTTTVSTTTSAAGPTAAAASFILLTALLSAIFLRV